MSQRARASRGQSNDVIYSRAAEILKTLIQGCGGSVLDLGCGVCQLFQHIHSQFQYYTGADVVKYAELDSRIKFHLTDLNYNFISLKSHSFDVVISLETIEHLENPRLFLREIKRVCKPGGVILISTPNQLSYLSKITFLIKNKFNAFQDRDYPAHITALLEIDLQRIAEELDFKNIQIHYTFQGRIPFTRYHYPTWWSRWFPRQFSDNIILTATHSIC